MGRGGALTLFGTLEEMMSGWNRGGAQCILERGGRGQRAERGWVAGGWRRLFGAVLLTDPSSLPGSVRGSVIGCFDGCRRRRLAAQLPLRRLDPLGLGLLLQFPIVPLGGQGG